MLVLNYLRQSGQNNPEIEMKALQYVNAGYQRILTFECSSGGFNWWVGDNPGNSVLSAIAIMMLSDTKTVYDAVDQDVIQRTADYLAGLQGADGSWMMERHLHGDNMNVGKAKLAATCYSTWALIQGGFGNGAEVRSALGYITAQVKREEDLYTMGLCANALAAAGKKGPELGMLLKAIGVAAKKDGLGIHWEQDGARTLMHSGGKAASVEITALMALAYINAEANVADVPAIVNWLISAKDANGNWGHNTQASVLALKTLIAAATLDTTDTSAVVKVLLDGTTLGERQFDNFNKDVVWQVEIPAAKLRTRAKLTLEFAGKGNLGYEVVSTHFVPWKESSATSEPLTVSVDYDRSQLRVNETVRVQVKAQSNLKESSGMVLLTLGIPPGFDVLTEDLAKLVKKVALVGKRGAAGNVKVSVGKLKNVVGLADKAAVARVVRQRSRTLKRCLQLAGRKNAALETTFKFLLKVGLSKNGRVSSVEAVGDAKVDPFVLTCARAQLRRWRFPAQDGENASFEFDFISRGPDSPVQEGTGTIKTIRNFELAGRQLLVYLDGLPFGKELDISYRLQARYPIKAQTGPAEARLYYEADKMGIQASRQIEVK